MKKNWLIVLLAIFIVGGAVVWEYFVPHYRYYRGATDEYRFVECIHKGKKLYGMQRQVSADNWKEVIPIEYSDFSFQGGLLIAVRDNEDFMDLYTRAGEPIIKDANIKNFHYYYNNSAYNFYKRRFAIGAYVLVEAEEEIYAVFIEDELETFGWISVEKFGPFQNFVPGCSGYMFQDLQSKKWGFRICRYDRISIAYPPERQEDYVLLTPEYDQIVEHYNSINVNNGAIFVSKDNVWQAFNKQGEQIRYPSVLLDNILYLDPQPKVRENPRYTPFRYGIEDASVAFYNF